MFQCLLLGSEVKGPFFLEERLLAEIYKKHSNILLSIEDRSAVLLLEGLMRYPSLSLKESTIGNDILTMRYCWIGQGSTNRPLLNLIAT
mmetsp:Transcript_28829/g.44075  ORF Transcript_28829/g.44075 Transcript_28829/m.44075 type:complete len:89 (-) Transcript_28829:431-697(-)